jgi:hypothetical protein
LQEEKEAKVKEFAEMIDRLTKTHGPIIADPTQKAEEIIAKLKAAGLDIEAIREEQRRAELERMAETHEAGKNDQMRLLMDSKPVEVTEVYIGSELASESKEYQAMKAEQRAKANKTFAGRSADELIADINARVAARAAAGDPDALMDDEL